MLILVQTKKWAGSNLYISIHLFQKFSNTSASKMYRIEHINHDTCQDLLFQKFPILF